MTKSVTQDYEQAKKALFDHVGLTPDWVEYAIEIMEEMYWQIVDQGDSVKYAKTKQELFSDEDFFLDEIHKQIFYPKYIYQGADYTLIFCDPHVDGCKWFRVFDNSKRLSLSIKHI